MTKQVVAFENFSNTLKKVKVNIKFALGYAMKPQRGTEV
jgi:hypothetical protein